MYVHRPINSQHKAESNWVRRTRGATVEIIKRMPRGESIGGATVLPHLATDLTAFSRPRFCRSSSMSIRVWMRADLFAFSALSQAAMSGDTSSRHDLPLHIGSHPDTEVPGALTSYGFPRLS